MRCMLILLALIRSSLSYYLPLLVASTSTFFTQPTFCMMSVRNAPIGSGDRELLSAGGDNGRALDKYWTQTKSILPQF